jgi:NADH-quinone oxidoreductase subunit L
MASMMSLAWMSIVVPFVVASVIALLGTRGHRIAPLLSAGSALTVLTFATVALIGSAKMASSGPGWTSGLAARSSVAWLSSGRRLLSLGLAVDSLSAVMLVVVGLVALMVIVFSVGYMHGDPGWSRYFALLSLFTGSMTTLVMADSFVTLFIGWELVGASSYLLIGFWYHKRAAAGAAMKAFLTTRVGDVAFLFGLAILWNSLGTLSFESVASRVSELSPAVAGGAAVLIGLGAMGKSAQFPFHGWLPDAMEGPTPVSALIHAATMVAAGVYLVARVWPLFEAAPAARTMLLVAGTVSALGAALIAVAQKDIKKVLAYSTISQLGFMFAALGVGAWFPAFFHLVTHAAFKGLLFLSSGSVIHGSSTQDLHGMGGLRKTMPWTFGVWMVGTLALIGVPGLAGFFSKDAVLESVWHASPVAAVSLFIAGGLTALYMTRATRLAFFGESVAEKPAHESPWIMLVPLLTLAIPAAAVGWFGSAFAHALAVEAEPLSLPIALSATAIASVGVGVGWFIGRDATRDALALKRLGWAGTTMAAAFHWDAAVSRLVVRPVIALSRIGWAFVDRLAINGAVEATGGLSKRIGRAISDIQTGNAQAYSAMVAIGVLLMLFATVWLGR